MLDLRRLRLLSELAERYPGSHPLLTQVSTEGLDGHPDPGLLGHRSIVLTLASTLQPESR